MTTYETYGTDYSFLTKHGITEAEAKDILWKAYREARYQAAKRAVERAKDLAWSRKTILEKLMLRWDSHVRFYRHRNPI